MLNPALFKHVYVYISMFYDFNNLMLHYELSFWGFLFPMLLEKTAVVVPLDWSQKVPFPILKVFLFILRYSLRILLVS